EVAGNFQLYGASFKADSGVDIRQIEIVQHDDVGVCGEGFAVFVKCFHFHLHGLAGGDTPRLADGGVDAATGGDVVFLDQEGVVQAQAVVVAAADSNGIFLREPQTRQGFAG